MLAAAPQLGGQPGRQTSDSGVVKDERGRRRHIKALGNGVPQLHAANAVHACLHQRLVQRHCGNARSILHHLQQLLLELLKTGGVRCGWRLAGLPL